MQPSIIRRQITIISVLTQALFSIGFLLAAVYFTHKILVHAMDASLQGRVMTVAALVRNGEASRGNLYFDSSGMPPSLDPDHPDLYAVWVEDSGLIARSANWPAGLDISPTRRHHFDFEWAKVAYRGLRISEIPVLCNPQNKPAQPAMLTIIYAAPKSAMHAQIRKVALSVTFASLLLVFVSSMMIRWTVGRTLERP